MEIVKIHIREQIAPDWSDWLGGMSVSHTNNGQTILSGELRDHAALRGLLNGLFDLNLQLASLTSFRVDSPGEVERCES